MTDAEKEIWRAAYAAAFVRSVASVARAGNTTMGGELDRDGARYMHAEAARGVADEAVLGLRETEDGHATGLSNEALKTMMGKA
jgi:hypothetical protein